MQRLGPAFVDTVVNIAWGETKAAVGLPANNFNGKSIQAAGAFSWNTLPYKGVQKMGVWTSNRSNVPVTLTIHDELMVPVRVYATLWQQAKRAGQSDLTAARFLRYWHKTPTAARRWANNGYQGWHSVSVSERVDYHLLRSPWAVQRFQRLVA